MKSKLLLIITALIVLNLAACDNKQPEEAVKAIAIETTAGYNATLVQGIQFADKPNYPSFIKSVTGMSDYETLGRWTDGKNVVFTFTQNLPANFTLEIDLADTLSTNSGKEIQVQVGDWKGQFLGVINASNNKLLVKTTTPADSIIFTIPAPESPVNLGTGQDIRMLGIKFKRLSVIE
jgi:hypothetical protein